MRSIVVALALTLGAAAAPTILIAQPRINVQADATEFSNITLGKPETGTLTIGRIALSGFKLEGDRVRATRAEFQNMVATIGTSRTEIPNLVVTDLSAPNNLIQAITRTGAPTLDWAAMLEATTATEITIATAKLRDSASKAEAEYAEFSLKGLARGIAQTSRLARTVSKTVTPTGDEVSTRMGETLYEKINIAETIRYLTGGGSGAAKPLVDRITIASFDMKMPQAQVDFGKVEVTGLVGRAPAIAMPLAAIQAMSGAMPEFEKNPNAKELAAYYREVLKYLVVERYSFKGVKVMSDIGPVDLGDIVMEKFSGNGLGRFSIAGIGFNMPTGPIRLGEFELKGLNWKGLMDFGLEAAISGKEPDFQPEQIMSMIPTLEVLRFVSLAAGTPFGPVALDEYRIELPAGSGGVLDSIGTTIKGLKFDISKLPPDGFTTQLKAFGYNQLTLNAQAKVRYVAADGALLFEMPSFEISDVGTVTATAKFVGVDLPKGAENIEDAKFDSLTIAVTDGGLGNRFFGTVAKGAGISPEAMRAAIGTELKQQAAVMFRSALAPGSTEAVEEFIRSGGQLVLSAKPRPGAEPVTLAEMQEPPPAYLDRMTVTIQRPTSRLNIMDQLRRP
jgi:hypothetical protein